MAIELEIEKQTGTERAEAVMAAIRERRSQGTVRPERPPREAIELILEAATWAPNHRLTEPWRFVVLAGEARRDFGRVLAEAQARRAERDGRDAAEAAKAAEKAARKPLRAPVVIAVAVEPAAGPKIVEIEEVAAGAAAVQNMLLAAQALGLATIWRTGEPTYDPAVKAFFGLRPADHLLGFVYVGFPDGPAPARDRTPADALTRWLGWDDADARA